MVPMELVGNEEETLTLCECSDIGSRCRYPGTRFENIDRVELSFFFESSSRRSAEREVAATMVVFKMYSDDWEEKHITPLGVLPVLKIHTPKIKDIIISEAIVIDFYLAKKAGLLGNNEWEEQVIKSIYSSAHYLRERFFMRVTYIDQESKKRNFSRFMEFLLPHFIRTMEFHLQDNGANGFFMGDRLSLADIHVAAVMDHFFLQPMGEPIRKVLEASELLMKVKQSVDNEPRLASWKKTQQYKVLEEETIQFYAVSAIIEGA
ncbi:hypothetical protein DFQ26_003419 [Actinomortierella ambigua]|nr:hypothetical protein DFQ26_003419 [Actinomortierella ambigua]